MSGMYRLRVEVARLRLGLGSVATSCCRFSKGSEKKEETDAGNEQGEV